MEWVAKGFAYVFVHMEFGETDMKIEFLGMIDNKRIGRAVDINGKLRLRELREVLYVYLTKSGNDMSKVTHILHGAISKDGSFSIQDIIRHTKNDGEDDWRLDKKPWPFFFNISQFKENGLLWG